MAGKRVEDMTEAEIDAELNGGGGAQKDPDQMTEAEVDAELGFQTVGPATTMRNVDVPKQPTKDLGVSLQDVRDAGTVYTHNLPLGDALMQASEAAQAAFSPEEWKDYRRNVMRRILARRRGVAEAKKNLPVAGDAIENLGRFTPAPVVGGAIAQPLELAAGSAVDFGSRTDWNPETMATAFGVGGVSHFVPDELGHYAKKTWEGTKYLGRRGLGALTGVPREAIDNYHPSMKAARPAEEVGAQFHEDVGQVKKDVISGSQAAYDVAEKATGWLYPKDVQDVASIGDQVLSELGTGRNPRGVGTAAAGAYDQVRRVVNDFRVAAGLDGKNPGMQFADAKKTLQDVDAMADLFAMNPAEFTPRATVAIKKFRNALRSKLGEKVPGYDAAMRPVAENAALYSRVEPIGGDLNNVTQRLLLAEKDPKKLESREAIMDLAQKSGQNYFKEIRDRKTADQFNKNLTRGSRNVNLWALLARGAAGGIAGSSASDGNPLATGGGALAGAAVDLYGGPVAQGILDITRAQGWQAFGPYANFLKSAASRGTKSLGFAHLYMMQRDPAYRQMIEQNAKAGGN